jgi:hypothetical protein
MQSDSTGQIGNLGGSESNMARVQIPVVASSREGLAPSSRGANQAVSDQTKPEIDQHAQIHFERLMLGNAGEGRPKGEIAHIAENNGRKSLNEVHEH